MTDYIAMPDAELNEEIKMLTILQRSLERCMEDESFARPNAVRLQEETDLALCAAQHEQDRRIAMRTQRALTG